jgi:hypothetical protein
MSSVILYSVKIEIYVSNNGAIISMNKHDPSPPACHGVTVLYHFFENEQLSAMRLMTPP